MVIKKVYKMKRVVRVFGALLGVSFMLAGCGFATISGMLFDAPGSESSPMTRMLHYAILAAPVCGVYSCAVALDAQLASQAASASTLFYAIVRPMLYDVMFLALAVFGINYFCGGRLACNV